MIWLYERLVRSPVGLGFGFGFSGGWRQNEPEVSTARIEEDGTARILEDGTTRMTEGI